MTFLELAAQRQSVRKYLSDPVEEEKLNQVLEAGRLAPTACNIQPFVFHVLRTPNEICALRPVYDREWFYTAPVVIVVSCDRSISWKRRDGKDYGDVDAAIAMDHMILAATELGLGTCWIGAFNELEARRVLKLPSHLDPVVLTPLGYSADAARSKMRKDLEELVVWDV